MTGRLVDMSFSLNRKQRITLEVDSDFRSLWDKLNQEPLLDIEIKKHRNKRSHSAYILKKTIGFFLVLQGQHGFHQ